MANIYLSNDNLLSIEGLRNASSGSYMNDATSTATLKDADGNVVTGQTFPVTMTYMSGTNGNYQATLENTLSMTPNAKYTATISATSSSGLYAEWDMELTATKRTA
jgi:hypothetical protein